MASDCIASLRFLVAEKGFKYDKMKGVRVSGGGLHDRDDFIDERAIIFGTL